MLLLLGSASAEDPASFVSTPVGNSSFRFALIPAIAYSSDVGVALGAATFLYRPSEIEGRFDRLTVSGAYTTLGPRQLILRWEQPSINHTGWGVIADLRVANDNQEPYWGEGAALGGSNISPGAGAPPDPFRFHDWRVFLSFTMRPAVATGPLPYMRLRWLGVDITNPGTLLPVSQPQGWQGGATLLGETGMVIDTRDREVDTRRGWLAYLAAFGSPPMGVISDGSFVGVDLSASLFVPLTDWAVLATRVLYDGKFGDVPFWERYGFEGLLYAGGLGGAGTIRGVARQRVAGDQKALATTEFRAMFPEHRLWDRYPVQLGGAIGLDVGAARQPGYSTVAEVGGFAGFRLLLDRAVLVRFEVGYAAQGAPSFYFVTGEQF